MGRNKIDTDKYITDKKKRKKTYRKRLRGLIKKAKELSKLCGKRVALVVEGETDDEQGGVTDLGWNEMLQDARMMSKSDTTGNTEKPQEHCSIFDSKTHDSSNGLPKL